MYTLSDKAASLVAYDPIEGDFPVRLDANESFLRPTERDVMEMARAAAAVAFNRYPDPTAKAVCQSFARRYGVPAELVTAGNGSDELIGVILAAFLQKGDTVALTAPDFAMYPFYAAMSELRTATLRKGADMALDPDELLALVRETGARAVVFSNPCNPTSLGLERDVVRSLVRACGEAGCLVLLDEAYMDFWDQSLLSEVADFDNLIVLRTCSKAVGLAALRLGFAVANERLTGVLRAAKSPYNVNAVSQAMARVVLDNPVYRDAPAQLVAARAELAALLTASGRFAQVYDSRANFVLVRTEQAGEVFDALKARGIVVRQIGAEYLRITAGLREEHMQLAAALAEMG